MDDKRTVATILGDLDEFERVSQWLYYLQRTYDAPDHYAFSAECTLAQDMYAMVEVMQQKLGEVLVRDHRSVLEKLARQCCVRDHDYDGGCDKHWPESGFV